MIINYNFLRIKLTFERFNCIIINNTDTVFGGIVC